MVRTQSAGGRKADSENSPRIDPKYARFGLILAPSKIHRWGVYATELIPAHRKVIEYTGEKISRRETKRRANSSDLIYLFTLDSYWTRWLRRRFRRAVPKSLLRAKRGGANRQRS